MSRFSRRDLLGASGVVLTGSLVGCAGLVGGSDSDLPDRVPLYARNERDEHVSLAYWCSTTASVPDDLSIDGVAQLESGEDSQLTDIPVEVSDEEADQTHTQRSPRGNDDPGTRPTPVARSTDSYVNITADLHHRDDQRNVLLHVDTGSDAFSETGYLITVLSEPVPGVGTPDQPVSHDSVPGDESVAADLIRIAPRSDS